MNHYQVLRSELAIGRIKSDMLLCMRTTIMINDDLFRKAKAAAATEGRTLTSLIEDALRDRLAPKEAPRKRIVLPTFRGNGVRAGIDLSNNAALRDLMDEDDHDFH